MPLFKDLPQVVHDAVDPFSIGAAVHPAARQRGTHTDLQYRFTDHIGVLRCGTDFMVVHNFCHPAAQILNQTKQGGQAHNLRGELCLQRPDAFFQPAQQGQAAPQTAHKGLTEMGVPIDQTRHHRTLICIDDIIRRNFGRGITRTNSGDEAAFDLDIPRLQPAGG